MASFGHGESRDSVQTCPLKKGGSSVPYPSAEHTTKLVPSARIGLLAAEGKGNKEITDALGTSHVTVGLWLQRILDIGLTSLQESPRTGRPKTLPTDKVQRVLSEVVRNPKGRARLSCQIRARHSGIFRSAMQRIWAANDLKPHCNWTFKLSNTPSLRPSPRISSGRIWIRRPVRPSSAAAKRASARLWNEPNLNCP